jgi:hypothetical protein
VSGISLTTTLSRRCIVIAKLARAWRGLPCVPLLRSLCSRMLMAK